MATPCRHQIARFAVANRVSRRKIGLCRQGMKENWKEKSLGEKLGEQSC
jgi:hypothetical protein